MKRKALPLRKQPIKTNTRLWNKCMEMGDRYRQRFADDPNIKVKSFIVTAKRYGFEVIDGGRHD